jgi:hypothetical protein
MIRWFNPLLRPLLDGDGSRGNHRLAVRSLALFFALWPLVVLGAALKFQVNPWLFGGWGAYSGYAPNVTVTALLKKRDGSQERVEKAPGSKDPVAAAVERYQTLTRELGALADPASILRVALRRTDVVGVKLATRRTFLDRDGYVRCEGRVLDCGGASSGCRLERPLTCVPSYEPRAGKAARR